MLQPIFIMASEFRKGDVIFPASRPEAYRVEEIKGDMLILMEFRPDGGVREIPVSYNWFSPIPFSVCRQMD